MINVEQYMAQIDAQAYKYAAAAHYPNDYTRIKLAMLEAAELVNDAWLREIARVMEQCKPKEQ